MFHDSIKLFEGSEFSNLVVASGAAYPSSADAGELFFKSDVNKLYVYSGSAWLELGSSGGSSVSSVAGRTGAVTLSASDISGLATVATTGAYSSLSGTPALATVATSGSYNDLSNTPTVISNVTLSGDVTGSGPGSLTTTLATVNANTGTIGSATQVPILTIDGKGRITAATTATIVASAAASALTGTTLAANVVSSSLTSVGTLASLAVTGNITTGGNAVGYKEILQNIQPTSYTCVLADSNKHIYITASAASVYTIPANASVAYPIGTALTFVSAVGAATSTIAINTDTLIWSGTGATGTRTIAATGVATAIKVTATSWIISGSNVT